MILPFPSLRARVRLRRPAQVVQALALALVVLAVSATVALAGQSKPPGTLVAAAAGGSVKLTWGASAEASGNTITYRIYRQTGSGAFSNIGSVDNALTYSDTAVAAGTTYGYKITATRSGGSSESAYSNVASATPTSGGTPPPPPPPTATVEVDSSGNKTFSPSTTTISPGGTVTWHWNGSQHNVTANSGQSVSFASGNKSSGTFAFSFPTAGTYRFNCTLHGGMTGTIVVDAGTAPPDTTAPAAPTAVTATAGDTDLTLDWADSPEADLAGYRVFRRNADGTWPLLPLVSPTNSAIVDTGLTNGTAYTYRVVAYDIAGNTSPTSATASATPVAANPNPPPAGAATVQVGASGLDRFTPASVTVAPGATVTWQWTGRTHNVTSSTAGVTYSSGDLQNGTFTHTFATAGTFSYRCTLHSGMNGTVVVAAAPPPPDTTAPAAPASLVATPGDAEVVVDWADNAEPDLAGYELYRRGANGTWPATPMATPTASAFLDSGLTNGTAYAYRVVAVDLAGNHSTASAIVSSTPTAPAPPSNTPPTTATVEVGASGIDRFTPPSATIATGGTVTWHWNGSTHNVTSNAGQTESFIANNRGTGTFTHTFTTQGTFRYTCTLHNGMTGTVVVADAPPPPDTTAPATPAAPLAVPGDKEIVVDWADSPEPDLAGYDLFRRNANGTWPATPLVTASSSSYLDSGLVNGTAYSYRVVAFDVAGNRSAASPAVSATPVAPATGGGPADAATVEVGANDLSRFTPPSPTVAPGATVTWHWNGTVHNVTSTTAGETYASADQGTGTFTHTFTTEGTFRYVCTLHSGMGGTIVVAAKPPPPDTTAPAAPAAPTLTPGDTEVTVNWVDSPEPDVAGYELYRSNPNGTWPSTPVYSGTATVFLDSGLTNGTPDTYRVVAFDLAGNHSTPSATATATPVAAPPPPVDPAAAADISVGASGLDRFTPPTTTIAPGSTVTWHWSGKKHNVTSTTAGEAYASADLTTGTFAHTFATAGTYTYVCTLHSGMSGSIVVKAPTAPADTTPPGKPATPATTADDQAIALDWANNPENDVVGYEVYRRNADGTWPATPQATPVTSDWIDTGLVNGSAYVYRVVAVDSSNNVSVPSDPATGTPAAPAGPGPSGPGGSQVVEVGNGVFDRFNPNGVSIATGTTVQWHWNGRQHNVTSAAGESEAYSSGDQATGTFSHTFSAPGTYHYSCTLHTGMNGTIQVTDTKDTTAPVAPGTPTATAGDGVVTLDWPDNPDADVAGYRVYRQSVDGTWPADPTQTVSSSAAQDRNLVNGTTYSYRVTAVDAAGNESAQSGTASAAPVAPKPAVPHTTIVHVANGAFTSGDIAIDAGDTVTWTWDGLDQNHTVTSDPGQADSFESHAGVTPAQITTGPAGGTFSHVFNTEGTFTYLCRLHLDMVGTVRVGADAKGGGGNSGRGNGTNGGGSGTGGSNSGTDTGPAPLVTAFAGGQTRVVDIANYAYAPAAVHAVAGDVVRWQWTGSDKNHTVTSSPGSALSYESHPGIATPKVTKAPASGFFDQRFDAAGTYSYYCRLHLDMKGTVVVVDRAAAAAAAAAGARRAGGTAPKVTKVRVKAGRHAAAVLSLRLSRAATITVTARRRAPGSKTWRAVKGLKFKAKAGVVRHRWRVLPRGRYRLTLKAVGADGLKTTSTVTLTVR